MLKECFNLSSYTQFSDFMSQGVKWKNLENKQSTLDLIRRVEQLFGTREANDLCLNGVKCD